MWTFQLVLEDEIQQDNKEPFFAIAFVSN